MIDGEELADALGIGTDEACGSVVADAALERVDEFEVGLPIVAVHGLGG